MTGVQTCALPIFLWRDTSSELWTPVHSFTLIKTPFPPLCTLICSLFIFAFIFIFHTICLILCIQQAGEIDNLPVSLGQSTLIVLCADSKSSVQTPCNSYFSGAVAGELEATVRGVTHHHYFYFVFVLLSLFLFYLVCF